MSNSQTQLKQGISLARAGKLVEARKILAECVANDPRNETAWLYLAGIAPDAATALDALQNVERLNPQNPHLPKAKRWATERWHTPAPPAPPAPPKRRWRWLVPASILAIAVLVIGAMSATNAIPLVRAAFSTPVQTTPVPSAVERWTALQAQLAAAKSEGDTVAVRNILTTMHNLSPQNTEVASELAQLYFADGIAWRDAGDFSAAAEAFKTAAAIFPAHETAQTEAKLAELYQSGAKLYQQAAWEDAANVFETIFATDPGYPYVDEILYSTYFNFGLMKTHQNELETALLAYRRASEVLPTATEASKKAAEVYLLLHPPTPTPTPTITPTPYPTTTPPPTATPVPVASSGKEVVVDISDQRTYLYQNGVLINSFLVSTGEPGRDTAPGHYQILDKIPMAYASTWDLDMPYWLGIYWAGPLENGFHALPTVRNTGYTLWDGYLGQRVSYGCIILSLADAEILYNWVDIGTPVTIRY